MTESLPPRLLRDVVEAGLTAEAAPALALFPAVHTAWADGRIQKSEHALIERLVADAPLPPPARVVVRLWLDQHPDNAEELLDLAWRMMERLPAPAQRAHADAVAHARAVARAAGPIWRRISTAEQQALDEIVRALGGTSTETARREALRWGDEVEDLLPGYTVVGPEEAGEATGPEAGTALDGAWPEVCDAEADPTRSLPRPASARADLRALVEAAFRALTDTERELLGTDRPLRELSPWQLCRFVLLLVCSRSTYDDGHADRVVAHIESGADLDPAAVRRLLHFDDESTESLVHRLVEEDGDVPLICRDYARLTAELFTAAAAIPRGDAFVVNMMGWHDLRSAAGHAWCLFVDRRRRVAVPLDPTSADGLWDIGYTNTPFNALLDGRGLANLSSLCGRLVYAPGVAAAAALLELVGRLGPEQRRCLAVRMLGQPIATSAFSRAEHGWLLDCAAGAPELLIETLRERGQRYAAAEPPAEQDLIARARRARLVEVLCAAGLLSDEQLPERLARERRGARKTRMHRQGVRRNDPCPCGSSKKFKHCCGR